METLTAKQPEVYLTEPEAIMQAKDGVGAGLIWPSRRANACELFRDLAFSVWNLRLPQFDRIPLRVMQASEPAVGIRLRVNLDRDSRSL